MYDNYNYPMGADGPNAPWNQKDREVEVTVSLTISKTLKITIPESKFDVEQDEDGNYIETGDFTKSDLEGWVREQCALPHENLGWNEDDFEVIYEG